MRLFLCLFLTACTSATLSRAPQSVAVDPFVLELERLFAPHVSALDRDLLLFVYENGVEFKTLADVQAREIPVARRFFEVDRKGGAAGPGLLATTDPVAGAADVLGDPRLLTLRVRAGSRVLAGDVENVVENDRVDLARLNATHACGANDGFLTYAGATAAFRNSADAGCRRAIIEAFSRLRIQVVLYPRYGASLAGCRTTGTGANVIDPFAIVLNEINLYTRDRRLEGNPEFSPGVATLFNEARDDWRTQARFGSEERRRRFREGFFRGVTPLADARDWKNRFVLKCGTKWAPESEHPVAAMLENAMFNADAELREQLVATAYAYAKAFPNETFEPARLRAVHAAVFDDLSLTPETQMRWLTAIGEPPEVLAIRARSLDGARGPASLPALYASFRDTLKGLTLRDQRDPLMVARLLARSGLGPVGQRILYNNWQLDTGGVPVLKGDIPSAGDEDVTEWRKGNRDLYLDLLARCRTTYATSSPDEIVAGECGLVSKRE